MENKNLLQVKVISPQDLLFQQEALSVTSKNSSGSFDMLPGHSDFITIIENQPIVINNIKKEKVTFRFPLAIIYITNNTVTIFAKTESPSL